jgi:hypothetical protein
MKSKIVGFLLVAGGSLFAQSGFYDDRYYRRQNLRGDYRDLRNDYAQVDRLRADVARAHRDIRHDERETSRDYYWRYR